MASHEFVTTTELADELRTSAHTVRYWRQIGKGPKSIKVGRSVLYKRSDIDAWLAALQNQQAGAGVA